MKGSRTPVQRRALLGSMAAIMCVSDYIRSCFLDGLDADEDARGRVHTVRNGVERWLDRPQPKRKMIFLAFHGDKTLAL